MEKDKRRTIFHLVSTRRRSTLCRIYDFHLHILAFSDCMYKVYTYITVTIPQRMTWGESYEEYLVMHHYIWVSLHIVHVLLLWCDCQSRSDLLFLLSKYSLPFLLFSLFLGTGSGFEPSLESLCLCFYFRLRLHSLESWLRKQLFYWKPKRKVRKTLRAKFGVVSFWDNGPLLEWIFTYVS